MKLKNCVRRSSVYKNFELWKSALSFNSSSGGSSACLINKYYDKNALRYAKKMLMQTDVSISWLDPEKMDIR